MPVTPYNGGEAAIDKERFLNARAEDYWTLRELFENGEIHIDPDDDKLAAQLRSIKWGIDSPRTHQDRIQRRHAQEGLPPPDRADTVAMAFSGRAQGRPVDVESDAGESITADLMAKAW
jgi:phage terminase large subunit